MNTITEQEKKDGWILLFDGKDFSLNWRGFRKSQIPDSWVIDDNTIHCTGGGEDLITKEIFKDFDLKLEWKNSGRGNSGVFFHVGEDETEIFHTGPEYQIVNNAFCRDNSVSKIRIPETETGACYELYAPSKNMENPIGEWNQTRILVQGNCVRHWLNGEKVVEYELGSKDWEERVANSKFKQWPNYGRLTQGHIALQDHDDLVWYRNIKIRKIK